MTTLLLAMDRMPSVRRRDANGFLHVEISNISKANVCGYYGCEIPGWQEMGLDADRLYQLYRHPDELARAADTFNNLPVLSEHMPVNPDLWDAEIPNEVKIGSLGTDAAFVAPYLQNSLVIYSAGYQDEIEEERQKELSCGYRYRADMTAGTTPDGLQYDGVMRDIIGNHVALVIEGRAGPDVVVGDELMKLKSRTALMISGALQALIRPLLAADAKVDIASALAEIDAKAMANDGAPKSLAAKVLKLVVPHLAADKTLDVATISATIAAVQPLALDEDKTDEEAAEDEDPDDKGSAEDEDPDAKEEGEDEAPDDKGAMDSATVRKLISAAEKRGRTAAAAIEIAKKDVFPHVGEVVGLDSAAAVYKFALDAKGISTKGVHPSAFKAMVAMIPGDAPMANDRKPAGEGKLAKILPDLPVLIRS